MGTKLFESGPDWKRLGLGIGISVLSMLTMTAAAAGAINRELIGVEWINYLAALILLASSFVGVMSLGGSKSWLNSLLVGTGLWLILMMINILAYECNLQGAWAVGLAIAGGGGAGALLKRPQKPRKNRYSGSGKRRYG